MQNRRISIPECRARVTAFMVAGQIDEAGQFIRTQLECRQPKDLRGRAALLDELVLMELQAGRIEEGLRIAKRSREMPRSRTARLNSYLCLCQVLIRRGRLRDARTVSQWMIEIGFPAGYCCVLEVVFTYVVSRKSIPQAHEPVLAELVEKEAKRLGIRIDQGPGKDRKVKDRILQVHTIFRASSKRFQDLLLAFWSSEGHREELVSKYLQQETVGYFRHLAKGL